MSDEATGAARGFLHWLSEPVGQLALAGAFGGLVKAITLRERPIEGLGSLIVGVACSIYASPISLVVFEPALGRLVTKPGALDTFAGFSAGIAGMAIVGFILETWRFWRRFVRSDKSGAMQ